MFASTITIVIAPSTNRVLNRVNQDAFGSEYQYSDANEAISMKIRHSQDNPDNDGLVMKRHNVFFERVVYPTPTAAMKKYSFTATVRHDKFSDPQAAAGGAKGVSDWLISGTILAELAVGIN